MFSEERELVVLEDARTLLRRLSFMAGFSPHGRWAEGMVRSVDFRLKLKEFLHSLSYNQWSKQQGKGKNLSGRPSAGGSLCCLYSSGVFRPQMVGQQGQLICP